jgi:hypothetical protein
MKTRHETYVRIFKPTDENPVCRIEIGRSGGEIPSIKETLAHLIWACLDLGKSMGEGIDPAEFLRDAIDAASDIEVSKENIKENIVEFND